MTKVCLYSRYSTSGQDRTSTAAQLADAEALAAREGLAVVATFSDEERSRYDDGRPAYQKMLASLQRGEFAGIVAAETSRISGNPAELHRLVAELRFREQFLLTVDGIDTRDETSEILLAVKSAIDSMEGRKTGVRTYRSLRERHKEGHAAGGRTYGYGLVPDGDYKRRVVDQAQAEIVREIFERYANGESAKTIVRSLNERRVPSPGAAWKSLKRRAVGWSHTTVLGSYAHASGILRNSIYVGRTTWNKVKGKKVPGTDRRIQKRRPESEWIEYHDERLRIVSEELWLAVQARLATARRRNHATNLRGRPARHLLTGFLVCGVCGAAYVVRNGRHYTCSSQTNGRDSFCTQRRYLGHKAAGAELINGIMAQLSEPGVELEYAGAAQDEAGTLIQSAGQGTDDVAALDRQIADLADTIIAVGKSDGLTTKLRELERRKRALTQRTANVSRPVIGAVEEWRTVVANLRSLADYSTPGELEIARARLAEYVDEVVITEQPDGVFGRVKLAGYKGGAQERT